MKKIVSIISIFAIILSATQFVLADYSDDTTITDGQFAYKKGTNNILAYVGTTGICEIPENTTLKGLTPSWAKDAAPITKLIINDNVDINMIISGELVNLNKLKEVEIKEGVTEIPYQFLKVALPQLFLSQLLYGLLHYYPFVLLEDQQIPHLLQVENMNSFHI